MTMPSLKSAAINLAMLAIGLAILNTLIKRVPVAGQAVGKIVSGL